MTKPFKKFRELLIDLLNQGKTPPELSLAVTIGALLGLFPILGVTTIMSMAIGRLMKLNIPAILVANYAVFPIQIFMIYVLIKSGEILFSIETELDYEFFKTLMDRSYSEIFSTLSNSLLAALVTWLIFSAVLFMPVYYLFLFIIKRMASLKAKSNS